MVDSEREALIQLVETRLRVSEGLRLKPYRCPKGFWSFGYGFNLEANPLSLDEIKYLLSDKPDRKELAEILLRRMVEMSLRLVEMAYKNTFTQLNRARQSVLVDLCYNMGIRSLLGFTDLRRALDRGDFDAAAEAMRDSLWYRRDVGKSRSEPLIEMMRTGVARGGE